MLEKKIFLFIIRIKASLNENVKIPWKWPCFGAWQVFRNLVVWQFRLPCLERRTHGKEDPARVGLLLRFSFKYGKKGKRKKERKNKIEKERLEINHVQSCWLIVLCQQLACHSQTICLRKSILFCPHFQESSFLTRS